MNKVSMPSDVGKIAPTSTRKVRFPKEDELRERIIEHLAARPADPLVAAAWNGYIGGLFECGVIECDQHSRLLDLLPEPGMLQVSEIFIGPDYVDEHPEVREEVAAAARQRGLSGAS